MSTTTTELDRKALKQPDEFATNVSSVFDRLSKHSTAVFASLGVLIAVGAGLGVLSSRREAKSGEALNALYEARAGLDKAYEEMAKAAPKPVPAKKGEPEAPAATADSMRLVKLEVDAKLAEPVKALVDVTNRFPGTRAAYEARVTLGDVYLKHGEAAKAVTHLQQAADQAPGAFERALALNALGYAQEGSGQHAEAVKTFERVAKDAKGDLQGQALLAVARNHELANANDQAKAVYDRILTQLPNTEASRTAELLKARLQ
jgi:tetratricopeptide (TPR) repeat protein